MNDHGLWLTVVRGGKKTRLNPLPLIARLEEIDSMLHRLTMVRNATIRGILKARSKLKVGDRIEWKRGRGWSRGVVVDYADAGELKPALIVLRDNKKKGRPRARVTVNYSTHPKKVGK